MGAFHECAPLNFCKKSHIPGQPLLISSMRIMDKANPRRRGRPPRSTTVPRDVLAGVWVQVLITRIKGRVRAGRTPSVRKACQEIVANGGIISAVGGNVHALVQANATRKKSWQRFQLSDRSGATPSATGTIFASHTITNAGTLHARYSDANKLVTSDQRVRLAWMNLVRQILGLPTKHPYVRPLLGKNWGGRS